MLKDGRTIVYLTNHYDGNGRVDHQTLADPNAAYNFAYTLDQAGTSVTRTNVTDPRSHTTRLTFNAHHDLIERIDAFGTSDARTTTITTLTDALTHATSYTYDTSDRVATRTDPLQKTAAYQYDGNDHLTQVTDRKGQVTSYQYDALDRLTLVTYADTSTTAYTYDAGDRVTQITDAVAGQITRAYDDLNRLTSETTPEGTVSYTYHADGRRDTMTVTGQPSVTYGYDDAHRLTSITQGTSIVSMTYDDADRRSTLTLPNGVVTIYDYDTANQLTGLTYTLGATTLGTLTYAYDAGGNRTTVGGTFARTGLPQALASTTYDAANRIATWSGQALSYDANGNLASDGLTSYTWNARNQLTGLTGAASASFAYDGGGHRRTRTTSGATSYLYDGANAAQELVGGSPTANVMTGGIDEVFQRTDGAGTRAVLTDALGSAVALVDGLGALQTQYTYEPFGATSTSGTASANPAQFTGRENDGTGQYYYRARYYDPRLQRFISEDPIGFGGGDVNLHAYTFNAPTQYRDPSGRIAMLPLAALCAGGAAGSALQDWMQGRKIDGTKAAAWCVAGLTLGFASPAALELLGYGAGVGAMAAGGAPAAARSAPSLDNLNRQLAAQEIAGGHAFAKHASDFGATSVADMAAQIENIMANPTLIRSLSGGRTAYWDSTTGVVVIRNAIAADGGTAFAPAQGLKYFLNLK